MCVCALTILCVHVVCILCMYIHAYYDNKVHTNLNPYLCLSNCCVHIHTCTKCGGMGVFPPLPLLVARMMDKRFLTHHTVPGGCAVCINIQVTAWWVYDI